ncbi:MAG: hypothetical protein GY847_01540 [Proteobacteria bacterium]|nr:hypothetical protein [Pseudomonadota bacterium]
MKKLALILAIGLLSGCSHLKNTLWSDHVIPSTIQDVYGFKFITTPTAEETQIAKEVSSAISAARIKGTIAGVFRYPIPEPIWLVRDEASPIPRVCARFKCTRDFRRLCDITRGTDCSLGFRGLATDDIIFIRRTAEVASRDAFKSLLIHEGTHRLCLVHHGPEMKAIEAAIRAELPKLRMRALDLSGQVQHEEYCKHLHEGGE